MSLAQHPVVRLALCLAAALSFGAGQAVAAPSLVVSGNKLLGADNVVVNGVAYDVRFIDGNCNSLFSGCNAVGDFAFDTREEAAAASAALLEQVFVDGEDGQFDSSPGLQAGCTLSRCTVYTPYQTSRRNRVLVTAALNTGTRDRASRGSLRGGQDTTRNGRAAYAVWSLHGDAPIVDQEPAEFEEESQDELSFTSVFTDEGQRIPGPAAPGDPGNLIPLPGSLLLLAAALPLLTLRRRPTAAA